MELEAGTYTFYINIRGIRIINMQIEKEDRHMSMVIHITRTPCQRYVSNWKEKEEREQKGGYEYKSKYKPRSARNFLSFFLGFRRPDLITGLSG